MVSKKNTYGELIRKRAKELGFTFVGFAKAKRMDEEARRLEEWLHRDYQGKMNYMERYFEKRVDPSKLVPGAKSVICLMYNYFSPEKQSDPDAPKISMYAYGKDYHFVIKEKLRALLAYIREEIGDVNGRCFVDSAPVLERDLAKRAGIGWTGKNTLLIHPKKGSYFFLAELILDLELPADDPIKDYCGTCRRCIDACPTDAISEEGYILDSRRCISYLTIELRDEIPEEFQGQMENWAFGCDICQEVCPWNRFSEPHREPAFQPKEELLNKQESEWHEITREVFNDLFRHSAVKRTKFEGFVRNLKFLRKSE